MRIQVERLDITQHIAQRQEPVLFMRRDLAAGADGLNRIQPSAAKLTNSDVWRVLQGRIGESVDWASSQRDELVRVPLFEYLLPDPSLDVLLQFGTQIGGMAAMMVPRDPSVIKMLIVLGNVFERPDKQPGYQAWAGFAVCSKNTGAS